MAHARWIVVVIAALCLACETNRAADVLPGDTADDASPAVEVGAETAPDSATALDVGTDTQAPDVPDAVADPGPPDELDPCLEASCTKLCASSADCSATQVCVDTFDGCCSECRPRECDPMVDECPPCSTCEQVVAGHPGQCVPIPCPSECATDDACEAGEHCETTAEGCCGHCVPDTVPSGCCDEDSDCPELDAGVTLVCRSLGQGLHPEWGVCVPVPDVGWCWTDDDCEAGQACHEPGYCGCQMDCDLLYAGPGLCVLPDAACVPVDPAWVEEVCDAASVVVFDGQTCRSTCLGCCGCEPFCDYTFDTLEACQAACGAPTADFSKLYLSLQTEGGFTGAGSLDLWLQMGLLHVSSPWGQPPYCSAYLSADTYEALYALAGAVDWAGVPATYKSPENPDCCCDQFVYEMNLSFVGPEGAASYTATTWCDESLTNGAMPQALVDFLQALDEAAHEVLASCAE